MSIVLYSINFKTLVAFRNEFNSRFGMHNWSKGGKGQEVLGLYLSSTDPVRISRNFHSVFTTNMNDFSPSSEVEDTRENTYGDVFISYEDFIMIKNTLSKMGDEENWDVNRKIPNNIEKGDIYEVLNIIDNYVLYYSNQH